MTKNDPSTASCTASETPASTGATPLRCVLSEAELAHRWHLSPKTLQRWRTLGLGPTYMKLSRHVKYSLDAIVDFEARSLMTSTSQRACHAVSEPRRAT